MTQKGDHRNRKYFSKLPSPKPLAEPQRQRSSRVLSSNTCTGSRWRQCLVELSTNLCEDSQCPENVPTRTGRALRIFAIQNRLSIMIFANKRPNFTSTSLTALVPGHQPRQHRGVEADQNWEEDDAPVVLVLNVLLRCRGCRG